VTSLYEEHADLYDLAFDWDVGDEVEWLLARLGPSCGSVLEPGCGSGRMLEAILRRADVEVVGVDRSRPMVEAARRRLAAFGGRASVVVADMTTFDLGRSFEGAVCPIGTLAHLEPGELDRHLGRMADHLQGVARYLIQLDLLDEASTVQDQPADEWEMERGDTRLRITWSTDWIDVASRRQQHRSRIQVLSGPRAGQVVEEVHAMTAWTPRTWAAAVEVSPFVQTAAYDGGDPARPATAMGRPGHLLWHELTRSDERGPSTEGRRP
jgi:SAM-dependent methyltransferase